MGAAYDPGFDEADTHVEFREPARPMSRRSNGQHSSRPREPTAVERLEAIESMLATVTARVEEPRPVTRTGAAEVLPMGARISRWLSSNALALVALVGSVVVAVVGLRDEWREAAAFRKSATQTHEQQAERIDHVEAEQAASDAALRRAVTEVQVTQVDSLERVEALIRDPKRKPEPLPPTLRKAKEAAKRAKADAALFADDDEKK